MIVSTLFKQLWQNKFYLFGLALQKGMIFLLIPFITWGFGKSIYAQYVTLYGIVQFLGMLVCLGVSSAVLVFWHQQKNRAQYSFHIILMVLVLSILLYIPAAVLLYFWMPVNIQTHSVLLILFLIGIYVVLYNLNTASLSILRAQFLSKRYFFSVLASSILLVLLVYFYAGKGLPVWVLLLIYIAALFVQTICFLVSSSVGFSFSVQWHDFRGFAFKILNYTLPFMGYTLMTLSLITLDKIGVAKFFPHANFVQYIYNFQFAYIVNLISIVVGMYSLPIFCECVAKKDFKHLKNSVYANYALVTFATVVGGGVGYVYARETGIHLSLGFWILVLAFGFTNIFTVNVGVFEAYKKSKHLVLIVCIPLIVFWVIFLGCAYYQTLMGVYCDFVLFYGWLTLYSIMHLKRHRWI